MAVRKIVKIDENKCDGCGLCVPACAEGAIQIIDGKACLVADNLCDGLGACLGECPKGAITIEEREVCGGGGCPGSQVMEIERGPVQCSVAQANDGDVEVRIKPQLKQWPVELMLLPPTAPFFRGADLLVCADCVPFADPNFHLDLLKGRIVAVGCPKLDDLSYYVEKLAQIVELNDLRSITVAYMEVPCCMGIYRAVEEAVARSGKQVPITKVKVEINGGKQIV